METADKTLPRRRSIPGQKLFPDNATNELKACPRSKRDVPGVERS